MREVTQNPVAVRPAPPPAAAPRHPARRRTLTRDDWIAAALETLTEAGPQAVAVERLATRLGATKGSFYWHFTNRAALLRAAIASWDDDAALDGTSPDGTANAGTRLLLNLLWHADDAVIGPLVTEILHKRLTLEQAQHERAGLPAEQARAHTLHTYALQLGAQLLRRATGTAIQDLDPGRV